jgi:hypothetical protein
MVATRLRKLPFLDCAATLKKIMWEGEVKEPHGLDKSSPYKNLSQI